MHLSRRIWIQLVIFIAVSAVSIAVMLFGYMKVPSMFGIGRYQVIVQLPETGGIYERGNVTYRGSEVGLIDQVRLSDQGGVEAVLSMESDTRIPADLDVEVHSVSAVGEQYLALIPRSTDGPLLESGDVISRDRASIPPDINSLLDATNQGLQAIPRDDLRTTIDESYLAFAGLGPDLSRFIRGASSLGIDAQRNVGDLINVVDNVAPVLDTQTETSDSVQAWAAHLAAATQQLKDSDPALRGILQNGPGAAAEVQGLLDRLRPTLPIVLANLVSLGQVAVTYNDSIEQILVLLPQGTQAMQAIGVANRNTKQDYAGAFLSFNLNVNLPPPCTTGFLPAQQVRPPSLVDYPERPPGDVYCRVPQDSPFNVRGARNTPCVEHPGKRAPTVAMCDSDEPYVPLNDGFIWKGDPNATLSGQPVPQLPPDSPPVVPAAPPPPITIAEYDPATGTYVGPDGQIYTQSNLANTHEEQTWQSMLIPPTGN